MLATYNFDKLADRRKDCSKKWDKEFIESRYGQVPDDYISMWIADLDFEVAPPIHQKFEEILSKKTFGYIYDYSEFYKSIQYYLKTKTDKKIKNEYIMLDYSIVNSLYHTVQAFASENGKVFINSPVYNPFREATVSNNLSVIENKLELQMDGRYHLNFQTIEKQLNEENPDMYILCSPHNPGGRVWTKEELEQIASLCIENDVLLVVDEAHSDHINNVEFTSILELENQYLENVVYLNSPNKPFNIAGLKTSYVIILNDELREKYEKILIENHIDEPNVFGIAGLIAAYTPEGLNWAAQSYDYILENYKWVEDFINKYLPELIYMPLDSTYVLWIDVSNTGMDGNEFTTKLAKETGVLVQEGSSFGQEGLNYIRLNLGTSKDNVKEAFKRIKEWM